jgi:hypothetical protein
VVTYALAGLLAILGAVLLWGVTGAATRGGEVPSAIGTTGATATAVGGTSTGVAPASSSPAPIPTTSRSTCRAGVPTRLVYPALRVDAPFERIGLDRSQPPDDSGRYPLGNPRDRTRAGWYDRGPQPGSGSGTVLTNGHTYRNGSAIFTEDFAKRVDRGQVIRVVVDNGDQCTYVVSRVWREVDARHEYPRLVAEQQLYDFTGPERLLLVTCGGSWNAAAQNYDEISIVLATPVSG